MTVGAVQTDMDPDTTAVLTVDLHHGHLDQEIATLPVSPETGERVLDASERLVTNARDAGYRIIHVTTGYRDAKEALANPKWSETDEDESDPRSTQAEHNRIGTKGLEIMPRLREEEDIFLQPKKRYSPFIDTDLPFVLRTHDIEELVIAGVNTNTCVQCTCFEATNRDYAVTVVEDCVGSMDGEEFHELGLKNIQQALGSVVGLDEALAEMGALQATSAED
jgi:nicotinamidase-related amidase